MQKLSNYKELIVWQKSMKLTSEVYRIASMISNSEQWGMVMQLKRSAISIPSNIAEGYGRSSQKSFANFLKIARGSLFELETQLLLTVNLGFINESILSVGLGLIIEISKMLTAIISRITKASTK